MVSKAIGKYLRISPQKTRLVADLIRKKGIKESLDILNFIPNKPAKFVKEVLKSAIANAKDKNEENLYIKEILICEGPILKPYRWVAAPHGRATKIRKRTSHITIILDKKI